MHYPEITRQIVALNHEIGNHDWKDRISSFQSKEEVEKGVIQTEKAIFRAAGDIPIRYFRPGGGTLTFLSDTILQVAHKLNYRVALADTYGKDRQLPLPWFQALYIRFRVRSGSIIVLHDHDRNTAKVTIETLKRVIPRLLDSGYEFLTLSQAERRSQPF